MQPFDHVEAAKEAVALIRTGGVHASAQLLRDFGKQFGGMAFATDLAVDREEFAAILGVHIGTVDWMALKVVSGVPQ